MDMKVIIRDIETEDDYIDVTLYFKSPSMNITFSKLLSIDEERLITIIETKKDCLIVQDGSDDYWQLIRKKGVYTIEYCVGDYEGSIGSIEIVLPTKQIEKHLKDLFWIQQYFKNECIQESIRYIVEEQPHVKVGFSKYYPYEIPTDIKEKFGKDLIEDL